MNNNKVVTYCRVSTSKQGLGLEAQRSAILNYLNAHPELSEIGYFVETFSGKEEHRPEFTKAMELCRRSGATMVVAKLDRLGRGQYLYSLLGDSSISFKALDIAGTSELEKSIRVAVAIEERKAISERTKSALQAKKDLLALAGEAYAQGDIATATKWIDVAEAKSRVKRGLAWWAEHGFALGSTHKRSESEVAHVAECVRQSANLNDANQRAAQAIREYLSAGGKRTYGKIARYLNDNNYKTPRGGAEWTSKSAYNLMARFEI